MFERFGEMDTIEEINTLANNLKKENDYDSIVELAKENGIDEEEAEDFFDGVKPTLVDNPLMGALGKLTIEERDLKINKEDVINDWVGYIRAKCVESEVLQKAIRSKKKSLKGCLGALLKWGFAHQMDIDQRIVKAAGIQVGKVTSGTPNMKTAKLLITEYYMG